MALALKTVSSEYAFGQYFLDVSANTPIADAWQVLVLRQKTLFHSMFMDLQEPLPPHQDSEQKSCVVIILSIPTPTSAVPLSLSPLPLPSHYIIPIPRPSNPLPSPTLKIRITPKLITQPLRMLHLKRCRPCPNLGVQFRDQVFHTFAGADYQF